MNSYKFNQLYIGMEESFTKLISYEMLENFRKNTGDNNPLHIDENYAKSKNFQTRVVYGMLTASFISTLGGMYLPGKYCVIHSVESKFTAPVYANETLKITGKITEIHEVLKQVVIKVTMTNGDGKKVLKGKLKVGLLDE